MLLTKTNIPVSVYGHNFVGHDVVCSKATVTADGGAQEEFGIVLPEKP